MTKIKAILIHSTGGDPGEAWFPWLSEELKKLEVGVEIPSFPTPFGQKLDNWMDIFEPYISTIDENTIFVGRSIAPAFILRILERIDVRVKACFFVSGFVSDLKVLAFKPLIESFIEKPFNWGKIQANCGKFYVYHGKDDKIVPPHFGRELADMLGAELQLFSNAGHFNEDTRFKDRFEKILEDIKEVL